jgi:hypothetical protein
VRHRQRIDEHPIAQGAGAMRALAFEVEAAIQCLRLL